jgi:hypothetical protein
MDEWYVSQTKLNVLTNAVFHHPAKELGCIVDVELRDEWMNFCDTINTVWYLSHFTRYHQLSRLRYFRDRFRGYLFLHRDSMRRRSRYRGWRSRDVDTQKLLELKEDPEKGRLYDVLCTRGITVFCWRCHRLHTHRWDEC